MNPFERTELLFGEQAMQILKESRVAVFGAGGVGGYVVEALARSGVGTIDVIDNDCVSDSNRNRQILATVENIGRAKVDVAEERIHAIHPEIKVNKHRCFFLPETADAFDFSAYSYVVDAIDTVSGKLEIVTQCVKMGVPVISSMGTGNKLDPTQFVVTDISKTRMDPLARTMRKELKKRGIEHLKVVYSEEEPLTPNRIVWNEGAEGMPMNGRKKVVPGSNAFVPPVAGLIIAGEVICDLTHIRKKKKGT